VWKSVRRASTKIKKKGGDEKGGAFIAIGPGGKKREEEKEPTLFTTTALGGKKIGEKRLFVTRGSKTKGYLFLGGGEKGKRRVS